MIKDTTALFLIVQSLIFLEWFLSAQKKMPVVESDLRIIKRSINVSDLPNVSIDYECRWPSQPSIHLQLLQQPFPRESTFRTVFTTKKKIYVDFHFPYFKVQIPTCTCGYLDKVHAAFYEQVFSEYNFTFRFNYFKKLYKNLFTKDIKLNKSSKSYRTNIVDLVLPYRSHLFQVLLTRC